jgi:hypothetical protein
MNSSAQRDLSRIPPALPVPSRGASSAPATTAIPSRCLGADFLHVHFVNRLIVGSVVMYAPAGGGEH